MIESLTPDQIAAKLEPIFEFIQSRINTQFRDSSERIAAFDLDNTLLIGDIGEAVFAQLKKDEEKTFLTIQKKPISLSWSRYCALIGKNRRKRAYARLVTSMAGLPLRILMETTRKIIQSPSQGIPINGDRVPIPAVNPTMFTLIQYLKKNSFRIFIISASNHFSVRMIGREIFDLPESSAFGIEPSLEWAVTGPDRQKEPVLTARLIKPIPFGRGKAHLYQKCMANTPPLLTAGDSPSDLFLLNLTHPDGLIIWMGANSCQFESMKKKHKFPGTMACLSPRH
jgi:hypothetical protein